MTIEQQFEQSVEAAKNLPSQSNQNLLQLYALYKQATVGDVNTSKPSGFDMIATAKYMAWADLEGTSEEEAKKLYIALVKKLQGS